MFASKKTILESLDRLQGTAGQFLKIWLTFKAMGLTTSHPVSVTTSSPNEALKRLYAYGSPDGKLFVPFSHTSKYFEMAGHAGRSIIQTTVKQWADRTAVGADPSAFLKISRDTDGTAFRVATGRRYPIGLGFGKNGFAVDDGVRVQIPDLAFAIWYYRQENLPEPFSRSQLIERLKADLYLTHAEMAAIFVEDSDWVPDVQDSPLSDSELFQTVTDWLAGSSVQQRILRESLEQYSIRIQSTMSIPEGPTWLRADPAEQLQELVNAGSKAILLFGPPRTGKTRAVDAVASRSDSSRVTIQIHDGWGYDELMVSFRPDENGQWIWKKGELLTAIQGNKSIIVLEEINRTQASQALGEVFSLLEDKYRGEENAIILRNGEKFFIPEETIIVATMNTLDKSTEDLDDALIGRFAGVEYPARVEDLVSVLKISGIAEETIQKLSELFATIQAYYPLGHGYFADLKSDGEIIPYYMARIRPVLQSHLRGYRDGDLATIDEKVDQLFNT